jgi:hypothetical protein
MEISVGTDIRDASDVPKWSCMIINGIVLIIPKVRQ